MTRSQHVLTGILILLLGMAMGMVLLVWRAGVRLPDPARVAITEITRVAAPESTAVGPATYPDMKSVAMQVTPTVVYIEAEADAVPVDPESDRDPSFWERLYPGTATTIGSGVLITTDGHILTNNHVVADAISGTLSVALTDKRMFPARVIGTDPSTDLAVIKIDGGPFPSAVVGNSDLVTVGDWVVAVGNPFRLRSTVTAGIVSALGRDVAIIDDRMRIESFIQTDAAINRGNSGGALVNARGELIGINTAIATENGSYQGYGFAVPINLAVKVARDLIEYGEVRRAYLGIQIVSVLQDRARDAGMTTIQGVDVVNVVRGGAADKGGLRLGDIILKVDGMEVNESNELQARVAIRRPGEVVRLEIWRDGRVRPVSITLGGLENNTMRRWADGQ